MEKIKQIRRCPFCGSRADLFATYNRKEDNYYIYVCCRSCNAQGSYEKASDDPREADWETVQCDKAIDKWNKRIERRPADDR